MQRSGNAVFYAGHGPELVRYELDPDSGLLTRREGVTLPSNVQYAWQHPSGRYLYACTSSRDPLTGVTGDMHCLVAMSVEPGSGRLSLLGEPVRLANRPLHLSLDRAGRFALVSYSRPADVTVHEIDDTGRLAGKVVQRDGLDFGIFVHQAMVTPGNRTLIVVSRGEHGKDGMPGDPGSLNAFDYSDGKLLRHVRVAPGGPHGFAPRHLSFHPTLPLIYVSLEFQSELQVFRLSDGVPEATPSYVRPSLADTRNVGKRQLGGAIHVHPNGRLVYMVNRADGTMNAAGRDVFAGGENSIAVFALNEFGEPTLIQHADTRGIHCRNFAIEPGGRVLVVCNMLRRTVVAQDGVRELSPGFVTFRIGADGRLSHLADRPIDGDRTVFWCGMVRV